MCFGSADYDAGLVLLSPACGCGCTTCVATVGAEPMETSTVMILTHGDFNRDDFYDYDLVAQCRSRLRRFLMAYAGAYGHGRPVW